jgi:cytochrome c-type biogenesis protein CcmH/NrfF
LQAYLKPLSRRFTPRFARRWNLKLVAAFVLSLSFVAAQDSTLLMTPEVARVGSRLACRCGTCRNTVGDCPMIRCHSADPMRHRIHDMQAVGISDDAIVQTIVQEEGIVALSSPPGTGWGLLTWVMPGIVLLLGFFAYTQWVRRNQGVPTAMTATDTALLERFRDQIDREMDEPSGKTPGGKSENK